MRKYLFLTAVASLLCRTLTHAQDPSPHHNSDTAASHTDMASFGFGFGQDFGGIGVNLAVYPQKNIGLFVGLGYALAGFGYNAGIKFRALPKHGYSSVRPFIMFMYGYNAAVAVTNYPQDNKLFYGPTVGAGIDIGSFVARKGFLSLAILIPIRNSDSQSYIDQLKATGVSFNGSLLPVTFSAGYKFILN